MRRERASTLLFIQKGLASAGGPPVIIVIKNHCLIVNPGYKSLNGQSHERVLSSV
jgi:hypothetical protein